MKRIIYLLVLASVSAFAAAPDSIGGKVYREKLAIASLRGASEVTIVLGSDGRFFFLKRASVNFVSDGFAHGSLLIKNPGGGGTFVYTKTGDSSAKIDLSYDSGSNDIITLKFTSATSGDSSGGLSSTPDWTFSLSDLSSIDAAPAVNISTRGHVAPGQPLIVGFIVPGTRGPETSTSVTSPDATQREVLIRVVGPSLAPFGVAGVCADPDFTLHRGSLLAGTSVIHYGDWSIIDRSNGGSMGDYTPLPNTDGVLGFKKIFGYVNAFPLIDGSKDAVDVVRLGPGAYTIVAYPAAGDPGGEVLAEVYFLP